MCQPQTEKDLMCGNVPSVKAGARPLTWDESWNPPLEKSARVPLQLGFGQEKHMVPLEIGKLFDFSVFFPSHPSCEQLQSRHLFLCFVLKHEIFWSLRIVLLLFPFFFSWHLRKPCGWNTIMRTLFQGCRLA